MLRPFGTPNHPRRGPDGEALWPGPAEWGRVDLRVPRRASFVVLCSKTGPVDWWYAGGSVPRDFAILSSSHPALAALMRAGYKVELEGAANPELHGPGHGGRVFRYLRSRIAAHRRTGPGREEGASA